MARTGRIIGIALALIVLATGAFAQDWRGAGRIEGKVVDEQGKGLQGVIVTATLPSAFGAKLQASSDKNGQWSVDEVGEGSWELVLEKDGYVAAKARADVDDSGRSSNVKTTLKKKFDPNAYIQEEGKKAEALMSQKNYAAARTIYEGIVAKVPEVAGHMEPFIGQAYFLEGKPDKAAEHLKAGLAKEPANLQARLLLVDILLETGSVDEASKALEGVDESKFTDPRVYHSFGLALLKKQKAVEAIAYFDKAVTRFPKVAESYYYRANALVDLVNAQKDPKDPERIKRVTELVGDLRKYLELAPNAPDTENAKKLLEQVEKQIQK